MDNLFVNGSNSCPLNSIGFLLKLSFIFIQHPISRNFLYVIRPSESLFLWNSLILNSSIILFLSNGHLISSLHNPPNSSSTTLFFRSHFDPASNFQELFLCHSNIWTFVSLKISGSWVYSSCPTTLSFSHCIIYVILFQPRYS